MNGENNKFAQISNIYSQFSEENRKNLIRTAQSLLKIQEDSEKMLAQSLINGLGEEISLVHK